MSAPTDTERTPSPKRAAAQRRARGGLGDRLQAWRELQLYSFVSSLGRIGAKPWATLLTVGVMAIALALPLGLWMGLATLEQFSGNVRESREIGVFLQPDVDADGARELSERIGAREDVNTVVLRSPEEGLAAFREMSDLAEALDLLEHNPLPWVLVVDPVSGDADAETALAEALQALPEVEVVQHDAVWRQRLGAWLDFGERAAWVIAILLGLGALLVVGNTVRLDIQGRSEEIAILQQLGATDGFVRRPFLYLGFWYGLAAGLVALALLAAASFALRGPLSQLIASYGSTFALQGPGALGALKILAGSALLGWLGAWLAAGHHLRLTRPVEQ